MNPAEPRPQQNILNPATIKALREQLNTPVLKLFADQRYLPEGKNHTPLLIPFWGSGSQLAGDPEQGRFDQYTMAGRVCFDLASLTEAHVALLPGDWSAAHKDVAMALAKEAQKLGKRVLIFFNHDSTEEIPIENSVIFRTSFYRSTRKLNEFAVPGWSVDFLDRYLGGQLPIHQKPSKPTVSFCGLVPNDPSHIRHRALSQLTHNKHVNTSFVIRSEFWGGAYTVSTGFVDKVSRVREEYVRNLVEGEYVLCARGSGNFSYRLYEALSCGRIPVFVDTDCVLPHENLIHWKKYCVWVDEKNLNSIGEKIAAFHDALSPTDFVDLQMGCRKLWKEWISPEGFFSKLHCYFTAEMDEVNKSPVASLVRGSPLLDKEGTPSKAHCIFLNTYYSKFLDDHYTRNPQLLNESYEKQKAALQDQCFGDCDFYSTGLNRAGWTAEDLIVNCAPLQQAWARESGAIYSPGMELQIAVEQIQRKKPCVVYLQCLELATRDFLSIIRPYTELIVGQIASPVPPQAHLPGLDIIFSSFPHFVERFRRSGIAAYYQPLAFEPRVLDRLSPMEKNIPVTFVGGLSAVHEKGTAFLEKLCELIPIELWGYGVDSLQPDSPIRKRHRGEAWGLEMFSRFRQSLITINRHIDVAENFANNMRLFEATGCGALLLTDYKDNLNDLFEIGREVVAYRSPEECAALVKYYMAHPDEARELGRAGQARTFRDHSYARRMEQTAEILERHLRYHHEKNRFPAPDMSKISYGHQPMASSAIPEKLTLAWKSEEIPAKQRALVQQELTSMYHGKAPVPFYVLAECLRPHIYTGCSVLEIGCASGYYYEVLEYLLNTRISYTGVDYSDPLISMAGDYYPRTKFQVADGARLPFKNGEFHIAISSCVLLHVVDYRRHIAETARVAGKFAVAHRTPICRRRPTQHLKKFGYDVEMVELIFNEEELLAEFAANGLRMVKPMEYHSNPDADLFDVTYLFRHI